MASLLFALTLLGALGSGLVAGIFFAFSAFVMAALRRLPVEGGIAAMQSINVAVLNPLFFTVFFETAALSLVLAIAAVLRWSEPGAFYLLAGSLLYLLGCILVTMACNVPLNNRLATVKPGNAEGMSVWRHYLSSWTAWNHIRTAASLAAATLFTMTVYVDGFIVPVLKKSLAAYRRVADDVGKWMSFARQAYDLGDF